MTYEEIFIKYFNIPEINNRCFSGDYKELFNFLKQNNFFIESSELKGNMNNIGDLFRHSLNVYNILNMLNSLFNVTLPQESIIIVSFLHDVCKIDKLSHWPCGHGEKSIFYITRFLKLTDDEILAINAHQGLADERSSDYNNFSKCYNTCPLALFLLCADMIASSYVEPKDFLGLKPEILNFIKNNLN